MIWILFLFLILTILSSPVKLFKHLRILGLLWLGIMEYLQDKLMRLFKELEIFLGWTTQPKHLWSLTM